MTALPHLSAYLDGLPQGLDSYPEVKAKASLYRTTLDDAFRPDPMLLPPALAALVETPVPVSSWIPEVHSHAMVLVARDLRFDSDDAFIRFTYDKQRELFEGRLYRILMSVATPSMLLRTAALRWSSFHRGSQLTVEETSPNGATLRVDHPPHLWHGLLADGLMAGLRAVLDLSGARGTDLRVVDKSDRILRMRGSWFT